MGIFKLWKMTHSCMCVDKTICDVEYGARARSLHAKVVQTLEAGGNSWLEWLSPKLRNRPTTSPPLVIFTFLFVCGLCDN